MELLKYDPSTITGQIVGAMKDEGIPVQSVYAVNLTREEYTALSMEQSGRQPNAIGPLPIYVDGKPVQPSGIVTASAANGGR